MRLGDRKAPSCHRELVLLAHVSNMLFPLAIDLECWGIFLRHC